jgi:hypothetical protein
MLQHTCHRTQMLPPQHPQRNIALQLPKSAFKQHKIAKSIMLIFIGLHYTL